MTTFDKVIERVLAHEGGYVNHPADPGGATNFGITQRTLTSIRAVQPNYVLPKDVRNLTREQAKFCYRVAYWTPIRGDQLPSQFAYQMMDAYVNTSPDTVVRWVQRAAGVADDGKIGPMTLAAIAAADPADLVLKFLSYRLTHMTNLSIWPTFGKGWARRIAGNLLFAAEDN